MNLLAQYKITFKIFALIAFSGFVFSCNQKKDMPTEDEVRETTNKMVEVNKILVEKDQQRIKKFIKRAGWDMVQTETGLWYMITERGAGRKAETGQVIKFNYEVSLLDGSLCYSSDNEGPKSFLIGKGGVESGVEEGVLLLNMGDKATFIIPPYLAHGLPGDGNKIPPRSIIIYKIEVLDLSNP